jgi:hypothetical protein
MENLKFLVSRNVLQRHKGKKQTQADIQGEDTHFTSAKTLNWARKDYTCIVYMYVCLYAYVYKHVHMYIYICDIYI